MKKFLGSLSGYLYDPYTKLVYTTKRRGENPPLPLKWQRSRTLGRYLYLTTTYGARYQLQERVLQNPAFASMWFGESQHPAEQPDDTTSPTGLFMVSYAPSPDMPKVHTNEQSAREAAERLAAAHPGKSFVVSEIKGTVSAGKVVWG